MAKNRSGGAQAKDIEAEAATAGFVRMAGYGGNVNIKFWRITCCRCDVRDDNRWDLTTLDTMIANMRRRHWFVARGKPPRCPAHFHHNPIPLGETARISDKTKERLGLSVTAPAAAPAPDISPPPISTTESKVSEIKTPTIPQNPRIARLLFQALEEHFDVQEGRYRNAYSDQKISEETGAHLDLVIATRVQAFGELREDPEIGKLRDDFTLLKMEKDESDERFNKSFAELSKRLERLSQQQKLSR